MTLHLIGSVLASCLLLGAAPGPKVAVHDNRLSVDALDVPLQEVLRVLSDRTQLVVTFQGESPLAATPISARFKGLPLDEGLARLIAGWDYALIKDGKTGAVLDLVILAGQTEQSRTRYEGTGSETTAHSPRWTPSRSHNLGDGSRIPANPTRPPAEQPMARNGGPAQESRFHREALLSEDPKIRHSALWAMAPEARENPAVLTHMQHVALADPEQDLRLAAVGALVQYAPSDEVRHMLSQLTKDSDETLRDMARQYLQMLDDMEAQSLDTGWEPMSTAWGKP